MPLVNILFFAQVQERLGQPLGSYLLPDATTAEAILAHLGERHPEIAQLLPRCRIALDQSFVRGPLTLTETSELAVIPPVSGG
jgi:molybdopterin converting factor subunit 1